MKRKIYHKLLTAVCAFALLLSLVPAVYAADGPVKSTNINKQDYSTWSSTVKSYLYDNGHGLTRVEYVNNSIIVEEYDSNFRYLSGRTIPMELSIWGGFYAGKDANFLIFGQSNPSQSNSQEVIRVVKYSKDWQRQGQASLNGANTTVPFDAGSLRCDEYGGYLYIRTCHEMYKSSDGLNHQSNLTLAVKESDMTVSDSYYDVMNANYGYVSHSFNQFLIVDQSGRIITLDHGDAYPRGVVWMGYYSNAATGKFRGGQYQNWCFNKNLIDFAGAVGNNTTGGSVGGLEETSNSYVMAFNYDGQGGGGSRAVYLNVADKATGASKQYKMNNSGDNTTPVLAPLDMSGGYMLWNDKSGGRATDTLYYVAYIDNGAPSPVQQATGSLSDCQPISYNGEVVWYVTNNSEPVFYTLSAKGLQAHPTGASGTPDSQTNPAAPGTATAPGATTNPGTTTNPSTTTNAGTTTNPSTTVQELDSRNIDPNSPKIGEIIGGSASCQHSFSTSWYWYWSGTPGTTSCTENSYSYYTCSICGAKKVNGISYAPGHQYKDGVCTVCGENETDKTTAPTGSAPGSSAAAPAAPSTAKNPFTDVPDGAYYTDAVLWAAETGVTTGTSPTTFEPYTTCTRGQVVTFLWRAKGSPEPATKTNPFRDVNASSPYYKAILWAAETGITTGTSPTTFSPNDTCTNGHVVTFLWRAEGKPSASDRSSLAQSYPTDYYTNAVAWADTAGLLANAGAAFNPAAQSPRANIGTYLYRDLAE